MKNLHLLLGGAAILALTALTACNDDEPVPDEPTTYDDSYYADLASISSSDANFTATSDGGSIYFKTSGGSAAVTVECGCDWIAENTASDVFTSTISNSSTLTVSAAQNYVESDLTGTITLLTANARIKFATISITQGAYGNPEITAESNEVNIVAKGTLTAEVAVEATADWTAEAADAWLTVSASADALTLTAEENEDVEERTTKVTLTCTDGYRTTYEYINVTQEGAVYVTLSSEGVTLIGKDYAATVTVESNYDWDYSYDSGNGWYTVSRDGDDLTITSTKDNDTDEDFEGTVTITAGDGAENVIEAQISAIEYTANALILVYTITDAGTTITLPLQGTVDCTVNWGDGSNSETVTSTKPTHTYDNTGEYTVVINGTVTTLSHNGITSSSKINTTLTSVLQWGNTGLTNTQYAMYYCEGLTSVPADTQEAFANVTNCYGMFQYCTALTSIPEGLFTYMTRSTNFNYVFAYCSALSELPSELLSNCSSGQTFQYAFRGSGIKEIPSGFLDGCTSATSFYYTFGYCDALTTIPAGLFSKNTAVTTFYGVFRSCTALETVPEKLFANCSKVTTFGYAFAYCSSLKTVPEDLFQDSPAAQTFTALFYKSTSLTTVPEKLFANNNPESLTFANLFYGCESLTSVPSGLFSNNTEVTSFSGTFNGCTSLASVPNGLFANCSKAENFTTTFNGCTALTSIPADLFAGNKAADSFTNTFNGCTALTSIPENLFASNKDAYSFSATFSGCTALTGESAYDVITVNGESVKVHLFERSDYPDIYDAPSAYDDCYSSCTGLSDYTSIPKDWGGGQKVDVSGIVGTYTVEAAVYSESSVSKDATWTLKIYESTNSDFDVIIDGLSFSYAGRYPDSGAYIAYANYTDGQIVIPAQTTGYISSGYYLGWYPCTGFTEGSGWSRSTYVTNVTFTYDSATDTWTSDYGIFLSGFSINNPSSSYWSGFFDVTNPGIKIKRTSTTTGVSTQNLKNAGDTVQKINDKSLVIHSDNVIVE